LADTKSLGGLQSVLEFRGKGTVAVLTIVLLDYNYELKESSLTLIPAAVEEKEVIKKYKILIDGDMLTMQEMGCEDCCMTFKRVIRDSKKEIGLIGQWLMNAPTGKIINYVFTTDKHAYYIISMPGETTSSYVIKDDEIEMHRGPEISTMNIILKDNILILRTEDGKKEYRYTRMRRFN
jgi:hypothetical protein